MQGPHILRPQVSQVGGTGVVFPHDSHLTISKATFLAPVRIHCCFSLRLRDSSSNYRFDFLESSAAGAFWWLPRFDLFEGPSGCRHLFAFIIGNEFKIRPGAVGLVLWESFPNKSSVSRSQGNCDSPIVIQLLPSDTRCPIPSIQVDHHAASHRAVLLPRLSWLLFPRQFVV
ncbi:hypothetical protein SV7mr_49940 [Stieleria bergensis]|uniref:Uncharacterized protein n=1 Tax=Stieleria bergensis TaxID=2528025 RepID=A0A517T257_9BACT|nr:hypothetical protein SV7mr_49940 [Planctomycetes bacterium SV_7m_r]